VVCWKNLKDTNYWKNMKQDNRKRNKNLQEALKVPKDMDMK